MSLYLYISIFLPIPKEAHFASTETTKIYDRNGVLLYELLQPDKGKKSIIKLDELPDKVIPAFLAAEDKDFYNHSGINYLSTLRAVYQNLSQERIVSGGSTITQQLARNVLGNNRQRSYTNKIIESAYAIRFEHAYEKNEILEKYLNTIYFGNLSYGIKSAARDYFGVNARELDLAQIALLAGLPQSPSTYNPFYNYETAKKRQKYVLDQMLQAGYINQKEADDAYEEKLIFRANKHEIKAPHFVHFIINDLEKNFDPDLIYYGGLKVKTTLDYYKQEQIEEYVRLHLSDLNEKNVKNAAVLSINLDDNSVISWIGNSDYFDESIDGMVDMTHALRQPGSSIKPFTYLLALTEGKTLASTIADIRTQFNTDLGPYTPHNYDLQYHGLVRVREALASSFNIPAVKMLDFVGVNNFILFLNKFGMSTLNAGAEHYGLALTLGGGEVRMIDLANAYSTLANDGNKRPFKYIIKIEDSSGKTLFKSDDSNKGEALLGDKGPLYTFLIKDVLSDNKARLRGFGPGNVLELTRPAAVKTGTTRNFRDNWTAGFTPQILTVTWVGNADASPMHSVSGISGAGPIWHAGMEFLHDNLPIENFKKPDGIIEKEICNLSGLLKTSLCKDSSFEYFIKGSEPTKEDNMYKKFDIDERNGNLWVDTCPPQNKKEEIFAIYPPELKSWALDNGIKPPPRYDCHGQEVSLDNNESANKISISNPSEGDSYLLDTTIPDSYETIPLKLVYTDDVYEACWYLDNNLLSCTEDLPFTLRWTPQKGKHALYARIRLASENIIQTETVTFDVN